MPLGPDFQLNVDTSHSIKFVFFFLKKENHCLKVWCQDRQHQHGEGRWVAFTHPLTPPKTCLIGHSGGEDWPSLS